MPNRLRYDASAALPFIQPAAIRGLKPSLESARAETLADVADLKQQRKIPQDKLPLDAGFIELPTELLAGGADFLRWDEPAAREWRRADEAPGA